MRLFQRWLSRARNLGLIVMMGASMSACSDIWFATDSSITRQVHPLEIAEGLRALPEVQGYGNVANDASYNNLLAREVA